MLKKLIEDLKTLPSSVEDNSESQPETPENFTDLYDAIIKAEERIGSTNQEIIRAYYLFGRKLKDKFTAYKNMYREYKAQRKLNDEVAKQLSNDLLKNAIEKSRKSEEDL